MKSKFAFYEVVKVRDMVGLSEKIAGREGAILGMSSDENGKWSYAVFIEGLEVCHSCEEDALDSTGKFKKHEDFYSGDSIRVR
jgi:hypothetical protein